MAEWTVANLVAIYGAMLSTIIAVTAALRWLLQGPKASVSVFNPNEFWTRDRHYGFVVSNAGSRPFVVQSVHVSFHSSLKGRDTIGPIERYDQSSQMSPSFKKERDPHKENTVRYVPNVIAQGEEYTAISTPPEEFEPSRHWIRVVAYVRNSNRKFVGWASPVEKEDL
ncbi:hypothetical protein [Sulfitobacter geojensis]|uniref:hypothetical protein n=1 Tax=Sulfitobacter geojensis TaxID=1342299 RepID=UPI0012DCE6A0|nr:hypothetical protein [Sulfitobacter geojensis]NYI26522.1 hypothetical protein [Sulfitobacter geojensis]